ncbi:MAG: 50S ribosomal protein L25 [bacterium]
MERVGLKAQVRDGVGKGVARSVRRGGGVPAILYGRGRSPKAIAVEGKALAAALHTHAGLNVLIDLDLGDGGSAESTIVMIREIQRDIFRHHPIHVDFHAISLTERLETRVRVVLKGTAKGIAEGGVVEHQLREVLVECLPTQIPEQFELDVTELIIGRSLHASDLVIPEGVTLVTPPEDVIVTVVAPKVIEEEVAPAAAAAVPAEGAPAEGAPAEGGPEAAAAATPAEKEKAPEKK